MRAPEGAERPTGRESANREGRYPLREMPGPGAQRFAIFGEEIGAPAERKRKLCPRKSNCRP